MSRATRHIPSPRRRGFTLIELLVTIGIIAVLLTILLIAFGAVRKNARETITSRLLANIEQAIETFESETGYLPPLLMPDDAGYEHFLTEPTTRATTIVPESLTDPRDALRRARYKSDFSLTVYLLGAGDIDGLDSDEAAGVFPNLDADDGFAGPGFRDPGRDKSWGGARDRVAGHMPVTTGRVFGPYLDPGGLEGSLRIDPNTGLYRLYDAFDSPIRYYRHWPTSIIDSGQREQSLDGVPVELLESNSVAEAVEFTQDPSLGDNRDALSFEYMLLSAGEQPLVDEIVMPGDPVVVTPPVGAFGDVYLDPSTGVPTYVPPTGTLGFLNMMSSDLDLWETVRPLLSSNIKGGR